MVMPTTTPHSGPNAPPKVLVALAHPTLRRYVCDVIEQGCRCWLATTAPGPGMVDLVAELSPDAVVTDGSGFGMLREKGSTIPPAHVLVLGPDDEAYREAALRAGAGAWVDRGTAPTALVAELDGMLGRCTCGCRPHS